MEHPLYFSGANTLSCLPMGSTIGMQDGAIYGGYLFRMSSKGHCCVFRLEGLEKIATFMLDKLDLLIPHSNSVCFGSQFYREGDPFPVLYTNLYNNYPTAMEKEGMCCVYRILVNDGEFSTQLVQVLKVDFAHSSALWYSEDRKDVRPFGNFAVDTAANRLYAFVMRTQTQTTRFFRFPLPDVFAGEQDETLGVPLYRLTEDRIEQQFDTPYMHYMQGAACHKGLIYSVEGFTYPKSQARPALRVIDTAQGKEVLAADLTRYGLLREPEFIEIYDGQVYYSDNSGAMYLLRFCQKAKKLYYEDSHLTDFEATVTGCAPAKGGFAITLSATAFYPEGGGQPWDTGTLGESRVLAVREENDDIVHLCDKPLEVGSTVAGRIDWERRFDFMQQHSGEHMVSGEIHRRYGYHNVGFHMGSDVVTIDFDGPIPADALESIEWAVNRAIWEDLPVSCTYPAPDVLPTVNYRRKRDLPWPVRIVEFPGMDLCACCGTQVKRTGEIGLVKFLSCVKFHEGVRIEMVCGKRALAVLNQAYEQNRQVSQAFSAKMPETGAAARRMNDALAAEKLRAAGLEKQLFAHIARGYKGQSIAVHFEDSLTPAANRELCDAIAENASVAVTLSGSDEAGYSLCMMSRTEDMKAMGAAAIQALRGRGGGKREAFQGSVSATRKEIAEYFHSAEK